MDWAGRANLFRVESGHAGAREHARQRGMGQGVCASCTAPGVLRSCRERRGQRGREADVRGVETASVYCFSQRHKTLHVRVSSTYERDRSSHGSSPSFLKKQPRRRRAVQHSQRRKPVPRARRDHHPEPLEKRGGACLERCHLRRRDLIAARETQGAAREVVANARERDVQRTAALAFRNETRPHEGRVTVFTCWGIASGLCSTGAHTGHGVGRSTECSHTFHT